MFFHIRWMALRRAALTADNKDRRCVYDGGWGRSTLLFVRHFENFAILSKWSEVQADRRVYTNACFYTCRSRQ